MLSASHLNHLIFDLDGTLIDSRADLVGSINAVRGRVGLTPLEFNVVVSNIGQGIRTLVARSFDDPPDDKLELLVALFQQEYSNHLTDHTRLYHGLEGLLPQLAQRYTMSVATNKAQQFAEQLLEKLEIRHLFKTVMGSDSVSKSKPDPEHLWATCRASGFGPHESCMIGDHWIDLEAAANAGVNSILVTWGFGDAKGHHPTVVAHSVEELSTILLGLEY